MKCYYYVYVLHCSPGWCSFDELNKTRHESLSYVTAWHADIDPSLHHRHGLGPIPDRVQQGKKINQRHIRYGKKIT